MLVFLKYLINYKQKMSLFNLKNKSILITGSSRGIGKAIARHSALHGAKVIISSRKIDACNETASEINN
jgi:NAD(P)-dependent dehydrogenase (short-subunit alcohol dehydrogenase family)